MVFFGILAISLLWKQREKQILRSLQEWIESESKSDLDNAYTKPADVKDALTKLFNSRKAELNRMQLMETYRRDYIGNVAHELKTPLFTIQGYLDSVAEELEEVDFDIETVKSFLSKAIKNAERLTRIISDLDTITKYESGFLQLEFEVFDLRELVQEVIESMEMQADAKGINLYDSTIAGQDFMVMADKFRIRQVLSNLGYNSIKYSKEGGYTRFKLSNTGDKVIVEVSDNGIGIPSAHLSRIFERFYRIDRSRSRDSGGSGLGLSICKHIIEAHGEHIKVLSTEGAGSVFSFGLKVPKSEN